MEEGERCKASGTSVSGIEEPLGQRELPNELMGPSLVNVLAATLEQKQSQWTAMHCCASPTGLNLMFHFRSDQFHRSWRDFQGTAKNAVGGFQYSAVQFELCPECELHELFNRSAHSAGPRPEQKDKGRGKMDPL